MVLFFFRQRVNGEQQMRLAAPRFEIAMPQNSHQSERLKQAAADAEDRDEPRG